MGAVADLPDNDTLVGARKLNVILWKDAMGGLQVRAQLKVHYKKAKKDDDDD